MATGKPSDETIIEIDMGNDVLRAQRVSDLLAGESIEHQLVLSDDPYVGLDHATPHRLMLRQGDLERARSVTADIYGEGYAHEAHRSPISRRMRIGALVLGLAMFGPLIVQGVRFLLDLL